MNSPSPVTYERAQSQWKIVLRKIFRSRWTFVALQVLDLLTTLAAFHADALEMNPLDARLTLQFGRVGGVILSKLIASLIALGVKRLVWVVNLFYTGIVCWNVIVFIILSLKPN
jgi:hypothetical protein